MYEEDIITYVMRGCRFELKIKKIIVKEGEWDSLE